MYYKGLLHKRLIELARKDRGQSVYVSGRFLQVQLENFVRLPSRLLVHYPVPFIDFQLA